MIHFIHKNKWTVLISALLLCILIGLYTIGWYFFFGNSEKTLIVYFSRVGNTDFENDVDVVSSASINQSKNGELVGNSEKIAVKLQKYLGGDLFRIETIEKYPTDYEQTVNQARNELNQNARPTLGSHVENMELYDRIILIYPVWWGTMPMPVFSFLDEYDFSNKTIVPVATHKGSLLGSSVKDIRSLVPKAEVHMGIPISGSSAGYYEWMPVMLVGGIILMFAGNWLRKSKYGTAKIKYLFYGVTGLGVITGIFVIVRIFV